MKEGWMKDSWMKYEQTRERPVGVRVTEGGLPPHQL